MNRRKPPRRHCLVGLLLSIVPILLPAAPALRSASELDYPPFALVDADGRADGLAVDLLRAALARVGRDVTFEVGPWRDIKAALVEGRLDVLPLVGRTPEREPLFDFSAPIVVVTGAVVVREDGPSPMTLADLRGLEVAVMAGDVSDEYAQRHAVAGRLVRSRSYADALRDLSVGRFDAVLAPAPVARDLIDDLGLSNLRIAPLPLPGLSQAYCFAVREGDRDLLAELERGLAALHADGGFARISARWLVRDRGPGPHLWWLLAAAAALSLLLGWLYRRRQPRGERGAA